MLMSKHYLPATKTPSNNLQNYCTSELCTTGYSAADMFFNKEVQSRSDQALAQLAVATLVGPPWLLRSIENNGVLFNCAVLMAEGTIAHSSKKLSSKHNEFYEKRWFTSGKDVQGATTQIVGVDVPFAPTYSLTLTAQK